MGELKLHSTTQRTKALDGNFHLSPWHHLPDREKPGPKRGGERNSGGYTPTVVNLVISRLTFGYSLCCFFLLKKTFQKFQVSDAFNLETTISGSLSLKGFVFWTFGFSICLVEPKCCQQTGCKTWCRAVFLERQRRGIYIYYIYTYYIYILYIHIYIYICIYMPLKILAGFHVRNGGGWFRSFSEIWNHGTHGCRWTCRSSSRFWGVSTGLRKRAPPS